MVKIVKNYPVKFQINKISYADLCNNLSSFRDAQLRRVVTSLDVFVGDVENGLKTEDKPTQMR